MKRTLTLVAAIAVAGSAATAGAEPCPLAVAQPRYHVSTASPTIVEVAAGNPDFSTLVAAVKAAGLVDTLSGEGPFTVFAPTNKAFEALPKGTVEMLLKPENRDKLAAILTYHVVADAVESDAAMQLSSAETVQGAAAPLEVVDGKLQIGGANVVKADIHCSNGVIHVIDAVMMPPVDVIATALGNEDFSTLVAAVKAAALVETLQGEGPFTVFAPTNAAFEALPEGTVEGLLRPEGKDQLTAILTYHVVPGRVRAADVVKLKSAKTVEGRDVTIAAGDDGVMINGAKVIATDIECGNGVIHVIDSVLLPQ